MFQQERMLLNYLIEHRTITGLEALKNLGIMSYTKCISNLRAKGVLIESVWQTHRSRFGLKKYVQYTLIKVPRDVRILL